LTGPQKQAACGDNLCLQHAVWPVQRCWRVPRHYRCQHPARRKQDSATSKVTLTSSGTGLKWRAQLKHRTLASGRGAAPLTLQCSPGSTSSTSCPWCVVSCLPCVSQEAHAGTCHTSDATSTRRNNARDCFAPLRGHPLHARVHGGAALGYVAVCVLTSSRSDCMLLVAFQTHFDVGGWGPSDPECENGCTYAHNVCNTCESVATFLPAQVVCTSCVPPHARLHPEIQPSLAALDQSSTRGVLVFTVTHRWRKSIFFSLVWFGAQATATIDCSQHHALHDANNSTCNTNSLARF